MVSSSAPTRGTHERFLHTYKATLVDAYDRLRGLDSTKKYVRSRRTATVHKPPAKAPAADVAVTVAFKSGRPVAQKVCSDCKTSDTPMWRNGPNGCRSLCNACGIRYKRRKRSGKADDCTASVSGEAPAAELGEEEMKMIQREKQMRVLVALMQQQQQQSRGRRGCSATAAAVAGGRCGGGVGGGGDRDEVEQAARLLLSLSSGALHHHV